MKKFHRVPVLIIDNTFTFGGAINSLHHLISALDKEQFNPVIVTGQSKKFLTDHFDCIWYRYVPNLPWVNNRIFRKIVRLPVYRLNFARKTINYSRFIIRFFCINLPEALWYYRVGKKHNVALLHLNNGFPGHLSGLVAAKLLRVPCVGHLRGFIEEGFSNSLLARCVDHHIAISKAVYDLMRRIKIPEDRISIVHNAINLAKFRPSGNTHALREEFELTTKTPTFGLFTRIVGWKGVREFIYAAGIVISEIPEARAFVVGDSSDGDEKFFEEMKRLVLSLGLSVKIIFTGFREDVPSLMEIMDVIVLASIEPEPFGRVIIEGMAMEKPIVATGAGGPLDIVVEGETGFLVEPKDVKAMADAINILLRNPELQKTMGLAGRKRAERLFDNKLYGDKMANVYKLVMDSGKL